jgi:hypothetical protein
MFTWLCVSGLVVSQNVRKTWRRKAAHLVTAWKQRMEGPGIISYPSKAQPQWPASSNIQLWTHTVSNPLVKLVSSWPSHLSILPFAFRMDTSYPNPNTYGLKSFAGKANKAKSHESQEWVSKWIVLFFFFNSELRK